MKVPPELLAHVPQQGVVRWLGVRPAPQQPMLVVDAVEARRDGGLIGDYRSVKRNTSSRQVTLIQWEHLAVINALMGRTEQNLLGPAELRRNLVISGINLFSLKDRRFRLGQAILQTTGWCQPCAKLERRLGPGLFQAMRGHGGITAQVLHSGVIRLGDSLCVEPLVS
ncbi:MOSC domain-containing protein [Pseudomonas sp. 5P_3.1_Bac2]|uniref:MOSC domain-containing protein n=1 Tax=Pseudomonas sp. 5P_3.1_Bac2 TaxID=2971617 RepID=UPI0021CA6C61|nr:MOSC domain-containing protein [Pseudomonas sp. 5P_3.1_Bac2]MCU1718132.1 MOSC domain-containing protein [Pseudomonas sp. 5P_3.1_Bac2]